MTCSQILFCFVLCRYAWLRVVEKLILRRCQGSFVNRQSVLFSHYAGSVPSFKAGCDGTNGATGAQLSMELLT